MRKSFIYPFIVLIISLVFIIGYARYTSEGDVYTDFCVENGYDSYERNPDTEEIFIELEDKFFINCQQKNIINDKLEITNDWLESDFEPVNSYIILGPIIIVAIISIIFSYYAVNKDEWS